MALPYFLCALLKFEKRVVIQRLCGYNVECACKIENR